MTDWSEIFEQRLQTVLSAGPDREKAQARETHKPAVFELTPPWSTDKNTGQGQQQQQRGAQCDATAAFFNAIRRTQAGGNAVSGDVAGGSNAWTRSPEPCRHGSFGSAMPRPTPATVMTPAGQVFGAGAQHMTAYASTPASVPDAGRPIVQKLQESYSKRASDLHSEATQKLAGVQQTLEAGLDSLARDENAFLARVAEKQAQFGQPADLWTVKIQVRETDESSPQQTRQTVKEKDERVVDRIATMRAAGTTLETELARLWQDWGQAQNELAVVLRAIFGSGDGKACDNKTGHGSFNAILAEAEAEMEAAAAEAVQAMRDNEKTFRKLILAEECKLAQAMLSRQSKYD